MSFGDDDQAKFITTYFRHAFTVADPTVFTNLTARLQRDDGAVICLNGSEVWRDNMPSGPIGYTNPASTSVTGADETAWFTTNLAPTLLCAGTNVLAAEVHQANATSGDLSFDLDLRGQQIAQAPAILASPAPLTRYVGESAEFTASVIGTTPMVLQWRREGMPVAEGTHLTLTLPQLSPAQAGGYSLLASNAAGSATSSVATLAVVPWPAASIGYSSEGLTLSCLSQAGRTYTILVSTNLAAWSVWTNLAATGSHVILIDAFAATATQRFYQVRVEP